MGNLMVEDPLVRSWVGLRMADDRPHIDAERVIVGGAFDPQQDGLVRIQRFSGKALPAQREAGLMLFGLLAVERRIDACRDLSKTCALPELAWLELVPDPRKHVDGTLYAAFKADMSDDGVMIHRTLLDPDGANGAYETVRMLDEVLRSITGLDLNEKE